VCLNNQPPCASIAARNTSSRAASLGINLSAETLEQLTAKPAPFLDICSRQLDGQVGTVNRTNGYPSSFLR
jgi:hypothetical protein